MPNLSKWYKKNSIRNDAFLSLAFALFLWFIGPRFIPPPSPEFSPTQVVTMMVSVMGQFASITIASLAIVAGFVDSKYLNEIRKKDWFPDIWRFLAITGCAFVGGIGLGMMTLFFGVDTYIALGFLALTVFLFVQVYRCIRLLYLLISIINQYQ